MCIIGKDGLKTAGVKFLDTDKLLKQFRENYEQNPKLKWQYFADESYGILYSYPSAKVCTEHDWRYRQEHKYTAFIYIIIFTMDSCNLQLQYIESALFQIDRHNNVVEELNEKSL